MSTENTEPEIENSMPAEEHEPLATVTHEETRETHVAPISIDPSPKQNKAAPGARIWKIFVFIFNVLLIIVIVSALGAALYFGWPIVYDQYILPVQNNTAQMAKLEKRMEQSNTRLAGVENQVAAIVTQEALQDDKLSKLNSEAQRLAGVLNTQIKSIEELQQVRDDVIKLQIALDEAKTSQKTDTQNLGVSLEHEIKILRGMELLSRARLFLYQSNFGLAKEDIRLAREILVEQGPDMTEVVSRLDVCLTRLPEFPVAASDDLDIAWQLLLGGNPTPAESTNQLSATPSPTPFTELSITPTAVPTLTPTVPVTPTVTVTPTPIP